MKVSQCLNPDCLSKNSTSSQFCMKCGSKLLLGDRYRPIRYIGEGGFGRTFEAVDEYRLDTPCVIKQFLPFQAGSQALEKATELFKQEAKQLCALGSHPRIPDLLAFFEQEGRLYLIQEFIEGQDLLKELLVRGRLSEDGIRQLLTDLLPVLDFIHSKNVIHRDIKPENIIRRRDGSLVLIDFGVSKQLEVSPGSRMGTITGTFGYAAPEQMRGMVYPSSDIYSLGVTAVRLLTGCLPDEEGTDPLFDAIHMEWIWRKWLLKNNIPVSNELVKILEKMLRERARDRFQSAAEVLAALQSRPKLDHSSTMIQSTPVAPPPPPSRHSPPATAAFSNPPTGTPSIAKLPVKLLSAVGVDYTMLHNLLVQGKWQQANDETAKAMLRIARREKEGWIKDIHKLSCQDIQTIDQLWVQASNGRFGFSVQKRVWFSIGGREDAATEKRLADLVGWRQQEDWLNYSELNFSIKAPVGHLPVLWGVSRVEKWDGVFYFLFSAINTCNL